MAKDAWSQCWKYNVDDLTFAENFSADCQTWILNDIESFLWMAVDNHLNLKFWQVSIKHFKFHFLAPPHRDIATWVFKLNQCPNTSLKPRYLVSGCRMTLNGMSKWTRCKWKLFPGSWSGLIGHVPIYLFNLGRVSITKGGLDPTSRPRVEPTLNRVHITTDNPRSNPLYIECRDEPTYLDVTVLTA